ncbi:hypothetical protein KM043_004957 [Ampulex compressa]|nr:hypothetical protein KM043_004957 [Ampulex compressa]
MPAPGRECGGEGREAAERNGCGRAGRKKEGWGGSGEPERRDRTPAGEKKRWVFGEDTKSLAAARFPLASFRLAPTIDPLRWCERGCPFANLYLCSVVQQSYGASERLRETYARKLWLGDSAESGRGWRGDEERRKEAAIRPDRG